MKQDWAVSMNIIAPPESSGRLFRYRRLLVLAAASLLAIGLALFAAFMDRGARSVRFEELQDGMTWVEVGSVLKPSFMAQLPKNDHEAAKTGMEMLRDPDLNKTILFCYSEDPLFPGFAAKVTFVDGHLTSKELGTPAIREILAHWWSTVWQR
jgi:hypothetical protein